MASYRIPEFDDVHRLLPLEILEDIGIAKADELRCLAFVEELASRLAVVLGNTVKIPQHHALPPATTADSYQHPHPLHHPQPQVYALDSRRGHFPGGINAQRQMIQALPFLNNSGMQSMAISPPRFAPARPPLVGTVLPPAKRAGGGTGVFLPRTEAYHHNTRKTVRQCRQKPPRYEEEEDDARRIMQRQQLHVHAHAVAATEMVKQQLHRKTNVASDHSCPLELVLPQEWIY